MKFSERINAVQPSLARHLFNLAKQFDDVIDLTLGDPDLNTPENIKLAGCRAIMENKTKYSANAGLAEARVATARHVADVWGVPCNPDENLIITVGGMEALYLALSCMVDNGDEVILFAPYYVNYVQMVKMCGGIPIIIDSYSATNGMAIDEAQVRKSITDKTIAIIINTPSNPTGSVISRADLEKIAKIAEEYDLTVISDEVYRTLIFDGKSHESILQFPQMQNRAVLIDSLSKEYCMTGWRVGYAYAPKELISNMVKMQENIAACTPVLSQYAMIEAYNNTNKNNRIVEEFQKRRDVLYERLCEIPGLYCIKPQATFYLFLNIERTGMNAYDFACQLLEQERVAVVPGETYGEKYAQYVRIAFTKGIPVLCRAVEKIRRFVTGL